MSDAILVGDAAATVIDVAMLAAASVHTVEFGIRTILLSALLIQRHLELHLPQGSEVLSRANPTISVGIVVEKSVKSLKNRTVQGKVFITISKHISGVYDHSVECIIVKTLDASLAD